MNAPLPPDVATPDEPVDVPVRATRPRSSPRRRRGGQRDSDRVVHNHTTERWMVSYADFITLLFAFFVVMYAMSSVNEGRYRVLSGALSTAFSQNDVHAPGAGPVATHDVAAPPPKMVDPVPRRDGRRWPRRSHRRSRSRPPVRSGRAGRGREGRAPRAAHDGTRGARRRASAGAGARRPGAGHARRARHRDRDQRGRAVRSGEGRAEAGVVRRRCARSRTCSRASSSRCRSRGTATTCRSRRASSARTGSCRRRAPRRSAAS